MGATQNNFQTKVGKVSIEPYRGSLRLRWTYYGKRYSFTIGKLNQTSFKAARAKAQIIDADMIFECLDETLAKYSPKHAKALEERNQPKPVSLDALWEAYQQSNQSQVSHSYKVKKWRLLTNLFRNINKTYYPKSKDIKKLFKEAKSHYSSNSLLLILTCLSACLNWAASEGYEVENPCSKIKEELKKDTVKKSPQSFTQEEISTILNAFYSDQFLEVQSSFSHSFYAPYVHFLALTGFRPEEAIALTWKDIFVEKNWIKVDKAFTHGELNKKTKTGEIRFFPINDQLRNLLNAIPRRNQKLVFPSVKGKYIDHHNFSRRYWKPVVTQLVEQGSLSEYLPPYHLRHSFITHLIREGHDIATVAKLAGNKPQTILNSYLSAMVDVEIPEFNF